MGKYLEMLIEMTSPASSVEKITPELACEYLEKNTNNRTIRSGRINELSGAMLRGEWMLTHQGIAFAKNGELIDGQHRLLAVVKSGVTVEMMVTRGCAPETFKALDLHSKRTASDIFHVTKEYAAALGFIARCVYGEKMCGPEQIQAIMGTELGRTCDTLLGHKSARAAVTKTSWVVGCAITCVNGDADYAKRLYDDLRFCNIENIPPIGAVFLKNTMNGTIRLATCFSARRENLAKALSLFDREKSKNVILRPVSIAAAMDAMYMALPEICDENGVIRK